jgi:hypothetical protein
MLDVNLLGANIEIIKKKNRSFLNAIKEEVGVEVTTQEINYMSISHHQSTGQNHCVKIANESFESMAELSYLGTVATNQNCIHK